MLRSLCFFFFFLPALLPAQQVYTEQFTDREGFSSPTIYDLLADSDGFIWEGTESGLVRFDGTHFKTVKGYKGSVSYLATDAYGATWCYAFSGKVFRLKNDSLEEPFQQLGYIFQYAVSGKKIYLRTKNSIRVYDAASFTKIAEPYRASGADTALIMADFSLFGDSLVVSRFEMYRAIVPLLIKGNVVFGKPVYPFRNEYLDVSSSYTGMYAGNKLQLSRSSANWAGLYSIRPENGQMQRINASSWIAEQNLTPTTLSVFDENAFWLNTYNGSYLIDGKTFLPLRYILPGYSVTDIIRDFQGNYWASTLKNGLLKIPGFGLYRHDNPAEGWPDNACFSLADAPGNGLYVGHGNGTITQTDCNGKLVDTIHSNTIKEVEAIAWDSLHQQVCAVLQGLWYKKTKSGSAWNSAHTGSGTKHLECVGDSVFYQVRNNAGVFMACWKNGKLEEVPCPVQNVNFDGMAWDRAAKKTWAVSRTRGLWQRGKDGSTVLFDSTAKASRILLHGNLLWLLDPEKGIMVYDPATRRSTPVCTQLCSGAHPRIFTSDDKHVYVLCENKLIEIDAAAPFAARLLRPGFSFSFYNIKDMRCRNGRLWFATLVGLYSIALDALEGFAAPRFLEEPLCCVEHGNCNVANTQQEYTQNNLRLNFSFIDYSGFVYRMVYRLDTNTRWQELEPDARNLQLLALSPDHYNLELALVGPAGKRGILYRKQFEIFPPFWKRGWFLALLVLLAVGIFAAVSGLRFRAVQMKNKLALSQSHYQEQLRTWQLSALRAQLKPHFMYNILNAIQGSIAINDKQKAKQIITLFADLSRKVLDASNTENSNLAIELDTIRLYLELENIRFNGTLHYRIEVEDGIDISKVSVPALLIQPLVENAVIHGLWHKKGEKSLVLRVQKEQNGFLVEIEDNGIGLEASARINARRHQHDSFGLKAIRKRLNLVLQESGRKITFSLHRQEEGTLARVVLPD